LYSHKVTSIAKGEIPGSALGYLGKNGFRESWKWFYWFSQVLRDVIGPSLVALWPGTQWHKVVNAISSPQLLLLMLFGPCVSCCRTKVYGTSGQRIVFLIEGGALEMNECVMLGGCARMGGWVA